MNKITTIASILVASLLVCSMSETSDGGVFRNRGFIVSKLAERPIAGAGVRLLQKTRSKMQYARGISLGYASGDCSTGACEPAPQDEATQAAQLSLSQRLANRERLIKVLSMLHGRSDLTLQERRAVAKVMASPHLLDQLQDRVVVQLGINPDTIMKWLELFVKYLPEIISIIMQIVA